MNAIRWTSDDPEEIPDDGKRYEVINGGNHVSNPTHWKHQCVTGRITSALTMWCDQTNLGMAVFAPGLIFDADNEVAPDVVWISEEKLKLALKSDGHLHSAPEFIAEVLMPNQEDEYRDRVLKRDLYSRFGVSEFWIVSWTDRLVEIYRREAQDMQLEKVKTLKESDTITSPLLSGFECTVNKFFEDLID